MLPRALHRSASLVYCCSSLLDELLRKNVSHEPLMKSGRASQQHATLSFCSAKELHVINASILIVIKPRPSMRTSVEERSNF